MAQIKALELSLSDPDCPDRYCLPIFEPITATRKMGCPDWIKKSELFPGDELWLISPKLCDGKFQSAGSKDKRELHCRKAEQKVIKRVKNGSQVGGSVG